MFKRAIGCMLVLCLAFVFGSCGKKLTKEEMLEKGKYLVNACGVLSHHTPLGKDGKPDLTRFMAGSNVGYQGPWGVTYPKNLTPDIETGIGANSNEEIKTIIKNEGMNGKAPLFSEYYNNLTEEDLDCIVVYLRSLTPIVNKIPADLKPGETVKTSVINFNQSVPKIVTTPVKAPVKAAVKKSVKAPAKKKTDTKKTTTTKKK